MTGEDRNARMREDPVVTNGDAYLWEGLICVSGKTLEV